jgi:hypothetical protein
MMDRYREMVRLLLAALLALAPIHLLAQQPPVADSAVKAAYLYQFGRYVESPSEQAQAADSFVICVIGEDPFGAILDETVRGKIISGHAVTVRRIAAPTESQGCRTLYIGPSETGRLPAILDALAGRTVLTVGDGTKFTERGGMIAFVLKDRKVRFVVNLAAARAARLQLSSELLRLAVSIEQ